MMMRLLLLVVAVLAFVFYTTTGMTESAINTLTENGYRNVRTDHHGVLRCLKGYGGVGFTATYQGKVVTGVVCVSPVITIFNYILLDD